MVSDACNLYKDEDIPSNTLHVRTFVVSIWLTNHLGAAVSVSAKATASTQAPISAGTASAASPACIPMPPPPPPCPLAAPTKSDQQARLKKCVSHVIGEHPVIITVPHGGLSKPAFIPNRRKTKGSVGLQGNLSRTKEPHPRIIRTHHTHASYARIRSI